MADEVNSSSGDRRLPYDALLSPLLGGGVYLLVWCIVGAAAEGSGFDKPEGEVWRALVSAQGVLWLSLLWLSRGDLVWALRRRRVAIVYFFAVLFSLAMATLAPRLLPSIVTVFPRFDLLGRGLTVFTTIFTTLGASVAAALATIIGVAAWELRTSAASFESLSRLRTRLRRCATVLSVVLVVAVTSSSWLSRAMEKLEVHGHRVDAYPPQLVFSYGIYLTTLLVLVYLPASVEFYKAAISLADGLYPMVDFDKKRSEARKVLLEELGVTAGDALQGAIATLGPVVTAIVAAALGKN